MTDNTMVKIKRMTDNTMIKIKRMTDNTMSVILFILTIVLSVILFILTIVLSVILFILIIVLSAKYIITGATRSRICDQLRDIISIWMCYWNVVIIILNPLKRPFNK
jgi:uncharacterized membrane protein